MRAVTRVLSPFCTVPLCVAKKLMVASATGIFLLNSAGAQEVQGPDSGNRVSLSATASVEVAQDWMTLSLSTTRDGVDAATVQAQLKSALEAALAVARPAADKDRLDLRTGQFSLSPRYGRDGKINGWQGSVELTLSGRDFERITFTAGKVQTLTLNSIGFGLSPAARSALESDLQARAIGRFKAKAQEVAVAFGHTRYQLLQVNVGAVDLDGGGPRPMLAMATRSPTADAAVPAEPGRTTVQLSVNGTVRLQ